MTYLTPEQAAELAGISLGYLNHLRTDHSKECGRVGPPYFKIESKKSEWPYTAHRIRYDKSDVEKWRDEREAQKLVPPKITRFAG